MIRGTKEGNIKITVDRSQIDEFHYFKCLATQLGNNEIDETKISTRTESATTLYQSSNNK